MSRTQVLLDMDEVDLKKRVVHAQGIINSLGYSKHATLDPPLKITYDTLLSLGNKILSRGIPIRSTEGVFLAAYLTDELPLLRLPVTFEVEPLHHLPPNIPPPPGGCMSRFMVLAVKPRRKRAFWGAMGLFHSPDLMFKDFGFVSLGDLVQDFCGSAKYAGVKVKRVIIGLPLEPPPKFDVYPLLQWQVLDLKLGATKRINEAVAINRFAGEALDWYKFYKVSGHVNRQKLWHEKEHHREAQKPHRLEPGSPGATIASKSQRSISSAMSAMEEAAEKLRRAAMQAEAGSKMDTTLTFRTPPSASQILSSTRTLLSFDADSEIQRIYDEESRLRQEKLNRELEAKIQSLKAPRTDEQEEEAQGEETEDGEASGEVEDEAEGDTSLPHWRTESPAFAGLQQNDENDTPESARTTQFFSSTLSDTRPAPRSNEATGAHANNDRTGVSRATSSITPDHRQAPNLTAHPESNSSQRRLTFHSLGRRRGGASPRSGLLWSPGHSSSKTSAMPLFSSRR